MTPEEAISIIKHYITCSLCVNHKAEADLFRVIGWLEGMADDRK